MTDKTFNKIFNETVDICSDILCRKSDEYAADSDRLHNFKIAAEIQHTTPVSALGGMMCKHTVSVYDLIKKQSEGATITPELWDEKIIDSINYLILLRAALHEERNEQSQCDDCAPSAIDGKFYNFDGDLVNQSHN